MTDPPMCRLCGKAHWARDPHLWPPSPNSELIQTSKAVAIALLAAPAPNPGILDREDLQTVSYAAECEESNPAPDKPDTAPSIRDLSDDELKPYFNEWMRRKMKARRAKPAQQEQK